MRHSPARWVHLGIAVCVVAGAPLAFAQKMHKCVDSSGAVTFQQGSCPIDPKRAAEEAEARAKDQERLKAEQERAKAEAARKKEEQAQKIRARDKAYVEKERANAEERRKAQEMEQRLLQGTSRESGTTGAGALSAGVETLYPAPWKEEKHDGIATAFGKREIKDCERFRYRQRAGGTAEFLVQCTRDGTKWVSYFVWPQTQAIKGPFSKL